MHVAARPQGMRSPLDNAGDPLRQAGRAPRDAPGRFGEQDVPSTQNTVRASLSKELMVFDGEHETDCRTETPSNLSQDQGPGIVFRFANSSSADLF